MASNCWIASTLMITLVLMLKPACSEDTFKCLHNLPSCGTNENNATLCCPYKNGVCCNNTRSCCPENSVCFPNVGHCMPRNKIGLMKTTKLYSPAPVHLEDSKTRPKLEVCPSKKLICPSKSTCCPAPYIGYDCCPQVNGVCCSDFIHCCPYNSTCNVYTGLCVDAYHNKFPWIKKIKADKSDLTHVKKIKLIKNLVRICQDQETRCEHNHTCCQSSNGRYECCAFVNAVCCNGGTHCCPPGTVCGNSTSDCIRLTPSPIVNKQKDAVNMPFEQNMQLAPSTHLQLRMLLNASLTLICPGGAYSCPDYMTCCISSGGAYGCCPYPNAVCCSDKLHCCPGGSQCDLAHNKCLKGGMFTPIFNTIKVKALIPKAINAMCPDNTTCPNGYTCCQLPNLSYGCCPLSSAVCCSDKVHCCPQGTTCDLETGSCQFGNLVKIQPLRKIKATRNFKLLP